LFLLFSSVYKMPVLEDDININKIKYKYKFT